MEQDMSPAWAKAIEHDNELERLLKLVAADVAEYCDTDTGGGTSFFAVCDYVEKALGDPDLGDHGFSFDQIARVVGRAMIAQHKYSRACHDPEAAA